MFGQRADGCAARTDPSLRALGMSAGEALARTLLAGLRRDGRRLPRGDAADHGRGCHAARRVQPADPRRLRAGRAVARRNVLSRAAVRVPARREHRRQCDRRFRAAPGACAQARRGAAGGRRARRHGMAGPDRRARQPRVQRRHRGSRAAAVLALARAAGRRDRRAARALAMALARARRTPSDERRRRSACSASPCCWC